MTLCGAAKKEKERTMPIPAQRSYTTDGAIRRHSMNMERPGLFDNRQQ
jgi:hypothetical protein